MTWGYPNGTGLQPDGSRSVCPKGTKAGCFPLGTLEELSLAGGSRCNESSSGGTMSADWNQDFACQVCGYACRPRPAPSRLQISDAANFRCCKFVGPTISAASLQPGRYFVD
jgi:hypothetical protein